MRNCLRCAAILLGVALVLGGTPLCAGVVYVVKSTYHSGSMAGPHTSELSVDGPEIKMGIQPAAGDTEGHEGDMIFHGDRKEMVVVDHRDKSYMVIDGETVARIGGQVSDAMAELEKTMENLDPKQREMMEKMLKGNMPTPEAPPERTPISFHQTTDRADKQGYPCVKYDVLRGDEKIQELWVTEWDRIEGGDDVVDSFETLADFFAEIMESFSGMGGGLLGGALGDVDLNPAEAFRQVGGFPVVTRTFEGGELESETVLESATERDLDPDAFEPPKGYRLRTMGPQ